MKKLLLLLVIFSACQTTERKEIPTFETRFEKSGGTETATYAEGIAFYQNMADAYPEIEIREMGMTDSGKPLHLVTYSADGEFDFEQIHRSGKAVMLINNAIHPGEPDGIEASMMFLRDVVTGETMQQTKNDLVLAIIPFYNIGGVLYRNGSTRANQNGPVEYGFRGNARNYDLNRDFIKGDTRNAQSFWEIFQEVDPDFFLDTHVSNGADYQYTMTLIETQKDKLSLPMRDVMAKEISPLLYGGMEAAGDAMTPYVNVYGTTPDSGFSQFGDWPRYSTGYAALFNTFAYMSETHMLKPYDRRVQSTYSLITVMYETLYNKREMILGARKKAKEYVAETQQEFPVKWKLDRDFSTTLNFKGYEASYIDSEITSQKRLFYDKSKPFEKTIPYRNQYLEDVVVTKPSYYVIPQGWHRVVSFLKANKVKMMELERDSAITVTAYQIDDYKTATSVYEGHYTHYGLKLSKRKTSIPFRTGDLLVKLDQPVNRFVIETLEPEAEDSYFKWNFFDMILSSKEGFSAYVFEELAKEILAADEELAAAYREKQAADEEFASNRYAQLGWIYERSVYKEPMHLRYPIFRID